MATKKPADEKIKARVLVNCVLGKPDDVVTLDAASAQQHAGEIDPHPDAVAYAESLAK